MSDERIRAIVDALMGGAPVNPSPRPTAFDYFMAGAKDFGTDATNTLYGQLRGPSFKYRQQLFDREPK